MTTIRLYALEMFYAGIVFGCIGGLAYEIRIIAGVLDSVLR